MIILRENGSTRGIDTPLYSAYGMGSPQYMGIPHKKGSKSNEVA
jgi:hypothetical protein